MINKKSKLFGLLFFTSNMTKLKFCEAVFIKNTSVFTRRRFFLPMFHPKSPALRF
jgi:hypothetical protein